jgi:hypothetical protein
MSSALDRLEERLIDRIKFLENQDASKNRRITELENKVRHLETELKNINEIIFNNIVHRKIIA